MTLEYLDRQREWRRLNRLGVRCAPPPKPRYRTSPALKRAAAIDRALEGGVPFPVVQAQARARPGRIVRFFGPVDIRVR